MTAYRLKKWKEVPSNPMHDLDGNVIPENAIIIGKAPKSSGKDLERGVCINGRMVTINKGKPYRRQLTCVHWIKNPTKEDKKIRREILEGIYNYNHRKAVKLQEGYVYQDKGGYYYLYLGKRHLTVEVETGLGWIPIYEKDGQFVYRLRANQKIVKPEAMYYSINKKPYTNLMSAQYGWTEIYKKMDLPETIQQITPHNYGGTKDYSTRLTLRHLNIEEEFQFGDISENDNGDFNSDTDNDLDNTLEDESGDGET